MTRSARTIATWLCCAATTAWYAAPTSADTIAYWRFESDPGVLVDSSGNGHTLTNISTTGVVLPASGPGSAFADPIPDTGDPNERARGFTTNQHLRAADHADFVIPSNTGQWTVEAFVNRTSAGGDNEQTIVGQWTFSGANPERSWRVIRHLSTGMLRLQLSPNGTTINTYVSDLVLEVNRDYYIAVSFDLSKVGAGAAGVRFIVLDLASGAPPQFDYVDLVSGTIHDSAAVLQIGASANNPDGSNNGSRWIGLIDEVRISDRFLEQHELLMHLPEPASALMLTLGAMFTVRGRCRRRADGRACIIAKAWRRRRTRGLS